MQDSSQLNYFGQRILQIIQPIAAGTDRREVLAQLAKTVADNFAADGCWLLHYPAPGVVRVAASACANYRTNAVSNQLSSHIPPPAPSPISWRMPLLADYEVTIVETRDRQQVNGCLMVATKGVKWYPETKMVLQIVADYVATALVQEELQLQAQISQIYPALHYHLTQAIVENQELDRLFEIAVSDMVTALQLKRGLVLTLKSADRQMTGLTPPATTTSAEIVPAKIVDIASRNENRQVQVVTTIDARGGDLQLTPPSFSLESSTFCQQALAVAPQPKIFDINDRGTQIDRLIFQDDVLPSMAMIPLMGSAVPGRDPAAALWGWLVLQHDRSRRWHPVELKLLECQIHQIALARIHKQALKQVRNTVANRTSQVQTSLQLQSKLHDAGRKRMEKLRQANELKDEFISTVSHELRTPLTSMSLAIEMLRQPDVDPDRRQQYLKILDEQCQREIKLVNDLLKLQQLESHQLELHPQPIALNHFISEQATIVADRWIESKWLELALHLPPVSPQLQTDADSLKHIIEELLVNAGKFALPNTMVEVWVSPERQTGGDSHLDQVTFQIANLSKPIASEDLPHLFDRFRRGTGTTQQAISGTGLGLALVKSLVEHLHGTIEVTSTPVEEAIAKTCFTVTIPTVLDR
jgi:signal transduction histidine kinase